MPQSLYFTKASERRAMADQAQTNEADFSSRPHILVVDDDVRICDLVTRYLTDHGCLAVSAHSADEARSLLKSFVFDAGVVDVMMPGESGLSLTAYVQGAFGFPVLLLTALGEAQDRIAGLEAGADDYLPKPFEPRELLLRLHALMRRRPKPTGQAEKFRIGSWVFDAAEEALIDGNNLVRLSAAEVKLLQVLGAQPGVVIAREVLAEKCAIEGGERAIDVQITRLRRKMNDDPRAPSGIQTVRGKGYLLRVEDL